MFRRTATGMLIQICTQFTGINVAAYFQPTCQCFYLTSRIFLIDRLFLEVYRALGLSGSRVLLITGINGLLGNIVTAFFVYFIL
jgi:hypothetical protein